MRVKRLLLLAAFAAVLSLGLASAAPAGNFDEQAMGCTGESPATCPTGTTGTAYELHLELQGNEDEGCAVFSVSSGNLPPGLTISRDVVNETGYGLISGTPTQEGTFDFFLTVKYNRETGCPFKNPSDDSFRISVNPGLPKLTLGPESAPVGTVGSAYSLQMTATVADAKQFSISSGTLPPGVAIDANTGLISGTPTTAGTYDFVVAAKVTADTRTDTKGLTITIRDALELTAAEPLSTPPLPTVWEVGLPFSATLTPSGGTGTYAWSIAAGALPSGLALGADGTIAGTPRLPGVSRATVRLTDTEGRTLDYAANFRVASRVLVTTKLLRTGRVGKLYRSRVASTGGVLPKAWRITAGQLPRGVRFDRQLGVLSGTPKKPGRYRLTFEVTDGLEVVAHKTLRMTVLPAKKPKKPKKSTS